MQEGPQMHEGKLSIHINSTSSLSLGFQPSSNNISHHIISWLRTSHKQLLTTPDANHLFGKYKPNSRTS